ncbi:MAG TPA: universal stress protein [Candidatus Limnocylindrales bacterium]|nr:universal stress protein [Candidatus Limnocylindrales bacterium]
MTAHQDVKTVIDSLSSRGYLRTSAVGAATITTLDGSTATPVPAAVGGVVARGRIKTIVFATDLTPVSESAKIEAIDLAASLGARLIVVNVLDPGDAKRDLPSRSTRLDQYRREREAPLLSIVMEAVARRVRATHMLWTGEPGQSIVAAAESEGADLIVVGTRALDREGRFLLGSVSDHVVYHSRCPVLVAR